MSGIFKVKEETRMKKMLTPLFLLMICAMLFALPAEAAVSAKTVTKAYSAWKAGRGITNSKQVDIDKNGIKEFMWMNRTKGTYGICTYSAAKKKVISLGSNTISKAYFTIYYNTAKHYYAWCTASTGGADWYVYKLNGTAKQRVWFLQSRNRKAGGPWYKNNGKHISYAAFDKMYRQIIKYKTFSIAF